MTADDSTRNVAAVIHYLFNMEAPNAKYLPSLVIAYPDSLLGVNTQQWINYLSCVFMYYSYICNIAGLVNLLPAGTSALTIPQTSTSTAGVVEVSLHLYCCISTAI